MKKKIAILALILCVASASTVFARGNNHGKHSGYHNGHNNRSYYQRSHGGHHDDGLEFAIGVAGGLILGSALMYSATTPPPQTVVYRAPYSTYPPPIVVQQPTICVEDRIVSGQWQINPNNGSRIWVSSPNPRTERVQVPCY
ncbi:MAG: hypothetical protein GY799_23200 [Desulfobulbaceae bacterium]|nr:hypothetical protein [Desulfobulbaceae bacterium]